MPDHEVLWPSSPAAEAVPARPLLLRWQQPRRCGPGDDEGPPRTVQLQALPASMRHMCIHESTVALSYDSHYGSQAMCGGGKSAGTSATRTQLRRRQLQHSGRAASAAPKSAIMKVLSGISRAQISGRGSRAIQPLPSVVWPVAGRGAHRAGGTTDTPNMRRLQTKRFMCAFRIYPITSTVSKTEREPWCIDLS